MLSETPPYDPPNSTLHHIIVEGLKKGIINKPNN
jgi:hypothetical protein